MFRRQFLVLLVAAAISWVFLSSSAKAEDVPRVTLDQLKQMIDKGEDIIILDNRPKEVYDQLHIKNAISFPWASEIPRRSFMRLPKNKLIITYCDCGPGEADSTDVANQLILQGFENVKTLADGYTPWAQKGYPLEGKK